MMRLSKKDYIYNGIYLTVLVLYYLLNVEVFNYTFKVSEMCDEFQESLFKESV